MRHLIAAAAIGLLIGTSAAFANGAKPNNPSGFGELVKAEALLGTLGDEAKVAARNDDGPGASNEVLQGHEEEGSTPNLPPTHP